ncbi:hypothetical protein HK405_007884, partial [Cladochytrium tenue]
MTAAGNSNSSYLSASPMSNMPNSVRLLATTAVLADLILDGPASVVLAVLSAEAIMAPRQLFPRILTGFTRVAEHCRRRARRRRSSLAGLTSPPTSGSVAGGVPGGLDDVTLSNTPVTADTLTTMMKQSLIGPPLAKLSEWLNLLETWVQTTTAISRSASAASRRRRAVDLAPTSFVSQNNFGLCRKGFAADSGIALENEEEDDRLVLGTLDEADREHGGFSSEHDTPTSSAHGSESEDVAVDIPSLAARLKGRAPALQVAPGTPPPPPPPVPTPSPVALSRWLAELCRIGWYSERDLLGLLRRMVDAVSALLAAARAEAAYDTIRAADAAFALEAAAERQRRGASETTAVTDDASAAGTGGVGSGDRLPRCTASQQVRSLLVACVVELLVTAGREWDRHDVRLAEPYYRRLKKWVASASTAAVATGSAVATSSTGAAASAGLRAHAGAGAVVSTPPVSLLLPDETAAIQ